MYFVHFDPTQETCLSSWTLTNDYWHCQISPKAKDCESKKRFCKRKKMLLFLHFFVYVQTAFAYNLWTVFMEKSHVNQRVLSLEALKPCEEEWVCQSPAKLSLWHPAPTQFHHPPNRCYSKLWILYLAISGRDHRFQEWNKGLWRP